MTDVADVADVADVTDEEDLFANMDSTNHDHPTTDGTTNHGTTTRPLTKELRMQACLGLGVLLHPAHVTHHLPHWLDLYVHWLRSSTMHTLQVKCIAALAHACQCAQSHLRLVETPASYQVRRMPMLWCVVVVFDVLNH
jgi:hypothetical protein